MCPKWHLKWYFRDVADRKPANGNVVYGIMVVELSEDTLKKTTMDSNANTNSSSTRLIMEVTIIFM